ncbi:MAG TPA: ATP-dependent helicase [Chitinophagaceae bacterium]|nr:ATP-dependent helicase [Chitinophagaceae bacterium]
MTNKIKLFTADDEYKEADFIISEVEKLVGGFYNLSGDNPYPESHYGFSDIAVLFRTRAVGKALLASFKQSGIPVRFGDASSFLETYPFHLVTDAIKLYLNTKDMIALDSLLTHGFKMSKKEKQEFISSHSEEKRFTALFGEQNFEKQGAESAVKLIFRKFISDATLDDTGLLRKETILTIAKEYGADIEQFLHQLLIDTYTDVARLKTDAVCLLTFHASKGLEFPVVFMAGAEEGTTPVLRKDSNIEEERRLFYVALTRAKDTLFITHAAQRKNYNETEEKTLSRFVGEIPAALIETIQIQKKQPKPEQMRLF